MSVIFVSYRRADSAGHAGRLFDRLKEHFGRGNVFWDVSGSIEPGEPFDSAIERAVGSCDVLLAIIGQDWVTCADATGKRRIEDPNDFVRLELAMALRRNVLIIPVLVERTAMPRAEDLPQELQPLARHQAIELSDSRWDFDVSQLIESLDRRLRHRKSRRLPRWHWVTIGEVSVLAAALVAGTLYFLPRDNSQQVPHPPPNVRLVGGMGGAYSTLTCDPGEVLRGFHGTKGSFFQQLGVICGKFGSTESSQRHLLGISKGPDDWKLVCPPDSVITGARIAASSDKATATGESLVGSLQLLCGPVQSSGNGEFLVNPLQIAKTDEVSGTSGTDNPVPVDCPQGEMVTTAHVRSGYWIDALGIECGKVASVNIVN